MSLSNRLTLPVKIALAPGFALALFLIFGVLCWWMLRAQEHRINVDLAGQLHVLQTVQDSERKLAEAHSALYRMLSAVRINAKQEILDKILKSHRGHAGEAQMLLVERIDDQSLDAVGRSMRGEALKALQIYIKVAKEASDAADMDINVAEMTMQGADQKFLVLSKQLGAFSGQQKALAEDARKELSKSQRNMLIVLVVALAAAILLTALVSLLITRMLLKQINMLAGAMKCCAEGDFTSHINVEGRDQIADLCRGLTMMRQTIKDFVSAQGEMKQQHDAGTISYRIDDKQFSGSYAEMAQKTNELVASHITVQTRVMEVVSQYAKGDLSVDMDKLPGEKAKITTAIDGVKANLQAVAAQIQVLVDAAGRGDFTVRGDEAKFEYEFRKMVAGLNSLMQTSDTGLNEVARVLGALAKGDLTEKISNEYAGTFGSLKDDCNKTVENLTAIVNQIKEAIETINTASGEITQGNTDLSQRTEEQASSLEETASSMEELTSTVKQNAENAKQANQLAVGASDVAVKGGDVVKQVVTTMSGISESSKKIADIIGTIDGIAFQTNILALNAAVEAARAGEQGRGFAVVATEVRNLAHRSANAAKEIKELITDSVSKVAAGTQLVDQAGQTMDEVVSSVKRVTDIMAEITAASQEQSSGIEQVNQAITQMDEVTQQNAALVEEAAAAAESMQEQAGNLVQSVSQFKLAQQGTARVAERRSAPRPANVARLPAKAATGKPARKAPANAPALKKAVGSDDDWQEF